MPRKKNTKKPVKKVIAKKSVKKKVALRKKIVKKPVKKVIAKKSIKKIVKKQKKHKAIFPSEEKKNILIKKARTRGFVTETEIMYIFPEIEEYIYEYELFLEKLDDNGIKIIESSGSLLDIEQDKKEKEEIAIGRNFIDLSKLSADSMQMYLKEIGKVSLLTFNEEIELAKRKEKGDKSSRITSRGTKD